MSSEDAKAIVAMLSAAFPTMTLEEESARLFVSEIALLVDGGVGLDAARMIVRQGDRFPTIKEFRTAYHQVTSANRASAPAAPEPPHDTTLPTWVAVWWWMRRVKGDDRALQQQGRDNPAAISIREYGELEDQWRAEGAPMPRTVREMLGV